MKTLHFALLAALLGGPALAQPGPAVPVKIATLGPLSGPLSNFGVQMKNGVQLAVQDYTPRLRALGLQLRLVGFDDVADPATGTANARRIQADPQILAVVGGLTSGVTIPVSAALAPSHLAMVAPTSTANAVTERGLANMFRVAIRDDAQGPIGGRFIADNLKAKRVYLLSDKTAYGDGLVKEVARVLTARGVQVVASEGTEEKLNFQPLVAKIRALAPDAVYFGGNFDQVGVFLKQLREGGSTVPVVGGDGLDSPELLKIAGPGAANTYYTTGFPPLDQFPQAAPFLAAYQKTFGQPAQATALVAYDAARVALEGVLSAARVSGGKAPTRAEVERALRGVRVPDAFTGPIAFDARGDRRYANMRVLRVGTDLKLSVAAKLDVPIAKP